MQPPEIIGDDVAIRLNREAVGQYAHLRTDNKNLVLGTYALIEAKTRKNGTAQGAPERMESAKRSISALETIGRRRTTAALIARKLQHTVTRMPGTLFFRLVPLTELR